MNAQYLKADFKWDFDMYMSRIFFESEKISNSINRFIKSAEQIREENSKLTEGGEVIAEGEIPAELMEGIIELAHNLQNEVFYNSLLVISFSFVEFALAELCRMLQPYIEKEIKPYYQFRNEYGIDKSKNYIQEAFDINIAESKYWSKLQAVKKHRHLIIHNAGNVMVDYDSKLENQPDYKLYKANSKLDVTETGFIFIGDINYVHETLKDSIEFIKEVNDKIKAVVHSKKKEREAKGKSGFDV